MLTHDSTELKGNTLELMQHYQQTRSPKVRNQLVQMNIGLVRREAHRWLHQSGESFDDLMQVGSLGLIRAIERFDLSKGFAFSSFAIPYIRGEIQHYLRDKGGAMKIPRRWQALQHQSVRAIALTIPTTTPVIRSHLIARQKPRRL